MHSGKKILRIGIAAAASVLAVGLPVSAQTDGLAMLDGLSKGEWTITTRDNSPPRKICVESGRELIQIRHSEADCNRYVVEDANAEVTVQYTCQGDNYGRTNIRRETNSLVQIQTQGFASGLPFQFAAEARRTGQCG